MQIHENTIPDEGVDHRELLEHLENSKSGDVKWRDARTWSLIYYLDEEHEALVKEAYNTFLTENYLNPFAWKSVQRFEREIISMTRELFHGGREVVGTFNSGGTESIFLAMYTYRERARARKKHIAQPEVVVPSSLHPAFDKAAHILGIKIRKVGVGRDYRADVARMAQAINRNTIMMAASAPSYPHGIMDPIEELGKVAQEAELPLHIDACIGSFMLPWIEELGYPVPPWDFRVPGVTSISADLHKFGYAPKGASALLYRGKEYLQYQIYVQTEWSGGVYAAATMMGSRSCGPVAAAWSAMKSLGRQGYLRIAERIMESYRKLRSGIESIPDLEIIGEPVMNILAYRARKASKIDIYVVADYLQDKGWSVDRQQFPPSIHTTVMSYNAPVIDEYLGDLQDAVDYARQHPKAAGEGEAAMYGLMSRVPLRGMVEQNVRNAILAIYADDAQSDMDKSDNASTGLDTTPNWMGALNRLLKFFGR